MTFLNSILDGYEQGREERVESHQQVVSADDLEVMERISVKM